MTRARSHPTRAAGVAWALLLATVAIGCGDPVRYSDAVIARHTMLAGAPGGFLLGVATSAHQIEGGNHNDWTAWEPGHYADGTPHVKGGATTASSGVASSPPRAHGTPTRRRATGRC